LLLCPDAGDESCMTTVIHHTTIITGDREPSILFNAAIAVENDLIAAVVQMMKSWRIFRMQMLLMGETS